MVEPLINYHKRQQTTKNLLRWHGGRFYVIPLKEPSQSITILGYQEKGMGSNTDSSSHF
jgi:hypothetical protein